jgi:hypothetical protein
MPMLSVLAAIELHDLEGHEAPAGTTGHEIVSLGLSGGRGATARPRGLWQWAWFALKKFAGAVGELLAVGFYASLLIGVGSRLLRRFGGGEHSEADVILFPVKERA